MALVIGSEKADAGMSQAIYLQMDKLLSPPLQKAAEEAKKAAEEANKPDVEAAEKKALDEAREGWKKLAFAIATGVIDHIKANMEVFGVTVQGNVTATVKGETGHADPGTHLHDVNLSGVANDVIFTQNNDGTGRIK